MREPHEMLGIAADASVAAIDKAFTDRLPSVPDDERAALHEAWVSMRASAATSDGNDGASAARADSQGDRQRARAILEVGEGATRKDIASALAKHVRTGTGDQQRDALWAYDILNDRRPALKIQCPNGHPHGCVDLDGDTWHLACRECGVQMRIISGATCTGHNTRDAGTLTAPHSTNPTGRRGRFTQPSQLNQIDVRYKPPADGPAEVNRLRFQVRKTVPFHVRVGDRFSVVYADAGALHDAEQPWVFINHTLGEVFDLNLKPVPGRTAVTPPGPRKAWAQRAPGTAARGPVRQAPTPHASASHVGAHRRVEPAEPPPSVARYLIECLSVAYMVAARATLSCTVGLWVAALIAGVSPTVASIVFLSAALWLPVLLGVTVLAIAATAARRGRPLTAETAPVVVVPQMLRGLRNAGPFVLAALLASRIADHGPLGFWVLLAAALTFAAAYGMLSARRFVVA